MNIEEKIMQMVAERITEGNLSCNEGQRITCSLRSEGRRTAQASIDLDDTVVVGLSIESILDVALTHDVEVTHALHGDVLQHLHLLIGKRTGWSHNDRFTCMDSEWVEVFHRGNGEAAVVHSRRCSRRVSV